MNNSWLWRKASWIYVDVPWYYSCRININNEIELFKKELEDQYETYFTKHACFLKGCSSSMRFSWSSFRTTFRIHCCIVVEWDNFIPSLKSVYLYWTSIRLYSKLSSVPALLRHLSCFTRTFSFIIVGISFQTWNLRIRMHILDVKSECKACSSFLNHLLVAVV